MNATLHRASGLTSVQANGRTGYRAMGIGTSGALDLLAARVANLLVGNDESAALLEVTLGGFRMRFNDDRLVAWCGASFEARCAEREIPAGHVCPVRTGDEIIIAKPRLGCRAWLAISGGIEVPLVLGNRSTDLRAGFGGFDGRTLRDGDELDLGEPSAESVELMKILRETTLSDWSAPRSWTNTAAPYPTLRFVRGVNWDRFSDSTHRALTAAPFSVTPDADRMGVRLNGSELKRLDDRDLLSEAVSPGTIQVPPSGQPILLLGDCQTIGGYPKIAHVITVDLPIAAQLRPRDKVRFQEILMPEAHALLLERERDFERFRIGLSLRKHESSR